MRFLLLTASSSSSLLDFQAADIQESNASEEAEEDLQISGNETRIASMDLSTKTKRQKRHSNLERLEAALQNARSAIKDANFRTQPYDPEYIPMGPMYLNSKVFHRSYLEMEKQFKVFVYEEGEPPIFHDGPCKNIYSMEGNFIHSMELDKQFRTKDPDKAHVYFLPFSSYVGQGPHTSFAIPYLEKNSIRALCNANTSERFNPMKDVSFPEINLLTGSTTGLIGGPSPSNRSILAFFAGRLHGPIRPILLEHWENKDDDIRVHRQLPKGVSYNEMMRKSKFCLCPSGYEVASPRIVEALYTGVCQC
ncbi:hypothetical protein GH714_029118 [Hevea brasiliensis]|uniref:Exostosin GT47 domain-containing protein n=1 Tax=Hevea brasiliensis TaxID=3981 RepID=A0A6A6M1B1_HEVBR|nr:hypothetical protein GH714_029118 [Hevea brasiliensis]